MGACQRRALTGLSFVYCRAMLVETRRSRTRRVCTYAVFSRFLLYCRLHCKYEQISTASVIALIRSKSKGQAARPAGIGSGEMREGFKSWRGTAERLETQVGYLE